MGILSDTLKEREETRARLARDVRGIWEFCKMSLTPLQQARVRRNVMNEGWSLEKAVNNEGLMFCRTKADLSGAKEMFENDERAEVVAALAVAPDQVKSFIPRPKTPKQ